GGEPGHHGAGVAVVGGGCDAAVVGDEADELGEGLADGGLGGQDVVVEDDARGGLPVGDVADVGGLGAADGDVGEVVVEGGELFEVALALAAVVGADEEPVGGEAGVAAAAGLVGGRLAVGGV